jgi:hypothetical protein
MTELSFLIELLLNHDLPKATKDLIASRIKEVETNLQKSHVSEIKYQAPSQGFQQTTPTVEELRALHYPGIKQAPSTIALMQKHGDIASVTTPIIESVVPIEQIAQTQATAAAIQSRQQAIAESIAGKVDKISGKPRKW